MVQYSRCFIAFSLLQDQLSFRIHCKYPAHRNAHLFVSEDVLEKEIKKTTMRIIFITTSPRIKPQCGQYVLGNTHTRSVSKGCVEGVCVWEEQVLDVREAFDLELLRLFFYDLSTKRITEKRLKP